MRRKSVFLVVIFTAVFLLSLASVTSWAAWSGGGGGSVSGTIRIGQFYVDISEIDTDKPVTVRSLNIKAAGHGGIYSNYICFKYPQLTEEKNIELIFEAQGADNRIYNIVIEEIGVDQTSGDPNGGSAAILPIKNPAATVGGFSAMRVFEKFSAEKRYAPYQLKIQSYTQALDFNLTVKAQLMAEAEKTYAVEYYENLAQNETAFHLEEDLFLNDTLTAPLSPATSGKLFDGWFTAPVGGTRWSFEDSLESNLGTMPSGSEPIKLYAQWRGLDANAVIINAGGKDYSTRENNADYTADFVKIETAVPGTVVTVYFTDENGLPMGEAVDGKGLLLQPYNIDARLITRGLLIRQEGIYYITIKDPSGSTPYFVLTDTEWLRIEGDAKYEDPIDHIAKPDNYFLTGSFSDWKFFNSNEIAEPVYAQDGTTQLNGWLKIDLARVNVNLMLYDEFKLVVLPQAAAGTAQWYGIGGVLNSPEYRINALPAPTVIYLNTLNKTLHYDAPQESAVQENGKIYVHFGGQYHLAEAVTATEYEVRNVTVYGTQYIKALRYGSTSAWFNPSPLNNTVLAFEPSHTGIISASVMTSAGTGYAAGDICLTTSGTYNFKITFSASPLTGTPSVTKFTFIFADWYDLEGGAKHDADNGIPPIDTSKPAEITANAGYYLVGNFSGWAVYPSNKLETHIGTWLKLEGVSYLEYGDRFKIYQLKSDGTIAYHGYGVSDHNFLEQDVQTIYFNTTSIADVTTNNISYYGYNVGYYINVGGTDKKLESLIADGIHTEQINITDYDYQVKLFRVDSLCGAPNQLVAQGTTVKLRPYFSPVTTNNGFLQFAYSLTESNTYNITFTLSGTSLASVEIVRADWTCIRQINGITGTEDLTKGYYLVGNFTNWQTLGTYKLNDTKQLSGFTLMPGDEFKIVEIAIDGGTKKWHGVYDLTPNFDNSHLTGFYRVFGSGWASLEVKVDKSFIGGIYELSIGGTGPYDGDVYLDLAITQIVTRYEVTLNNSDAQGGTETITVKEGDRVTYSPANIVNNGIIDKFAYWSLTQNGAAFTAPITEDTVLYAVWDTYYTVTFYDDDQATEISAQEIKSGGTATTPANPTKGGYIFMHWSLTPGGTEYNFATPVLNVLSLYAVWEVAATPTYTVTLSGSNYSIISSTGSVNGNKVTFNEGDNVSITIQANTGYAITAVSGISASGLTNHGGLTASVFALNGENVTLTYSGIISNLTATITTTATVQLTVHDGLNQLGAKEVPSGMTITLSAFKTYAGITATINGYWNSSASTITTLTPTANMTVYVVNDANLYLKPNDNWLEASAIFYARSWTGQEEKSLAQKITGITGANVYVATIAKGQYIRFDRYRSDGGEFWNNSTEVNTLTSNSRVCVITGWSNASTWYSA